MNEKEIIKIHKEINREIKSFHISKAVGMLESLLAALHLQDEMQELSAQKETYKYLKHYFLNNSIDNDRSKIYTQIKEHLHLLSDKCLREVEKKDSDEYYYSSLRFCNLRNENLSKIIEEYGANESELQLTETLGADNIALRHKKEELLNRLFNSLYTSLGNNRDYKYLTSYLASGYSDITVLSIAISAMTLSLLKFYDREKLISLIQIYENSSDCRVLARVMAALVFIADEYRDRIEGDVELISRLKLWEESSENLIRLRETIRVIAGTRDNDRITSKIKDEVIPEIMKLNPDIMKKMRDEISDPESVLENNPEWEEILQNSGINDKIIELNELATDGADMMLGAFSNLKFFPFFENASNWFLPFDENHTALDLDESVKKIFHALSNKSSVICDSDMYSLALASKNMAQNMMKTLNAQLEAQIEQMAIENDVVSQSELNFNTEVTKVVRDLYRFCKLFKKRKGMYDPFDHPLDFLSLPVVGDIINDKDTVTLIGEFYFKRGYYKEAIPLLRKMNELDPVDTSTLEKIGFAYQSIGEYRLALDSYKKAALLKTPGPWLTKKLAYVSKKLLRYQDAAEYYENALEMEPESLSLILNAGNMRIETGEIVDALQHYYHASYIAPDDIRVLRAMAWAELRNGNYEKSSELYMKVTSVSHYAVDYLNAGHCALLTKRYMEAVNYYRLAISQDSRDGFEKAFLSDIPLLQNSGVDSTELYLILDEALGLGE